MVSTTTRIAKPLLGMILLAAATGGGAMLWSKFKPTSLNIPSGSSARPVTTLETDPAHEPSDQRLAELSNQMAALKNELRQFKRAQNQKLTQLQAAAPTPAADAEPLSAEEVERQDEQANAAIQAQENRLEQTIMNEQVDPEWSHGAVTSWTEVFQKEGIEEQLKEIQLGNIECRTTLCRVELTPTDPAQGAVAFEQGFRKLMHFTPWQAPGFGKIEYPEGRAPAAVFYMAREGHALP